MPRRGFGVLVAGCVLVSGVAMAQPRSDMEDEDGTAKKNAWAEAEVALPPAPKPDDLLPFEPKAATGYRFFVDAQSIVISGDGVVHYTLVMRSASGAENITYEGLRCETYEQKVYAYGRRDGKWSPASSAQWQSVGTQDVFRQRRVLADDFFCRDNKMVKTRAEAIQRFKYPGPPTGGTTVRWRDAF